MHNTLFIALLAGLGGMIGWGFSEFATKKSVDIVGTVSSLVWAHIFGTAILFTFLFSRQLVAHHAAILPGSIADLLVLVLFGVLQTAVYYFAYKAFEYGEVSILSPIFASFAGIVALFSVLLFGEVLKPVLIPILLLVFVGTMLINLDINALKAGRIRLKAVAGLKEICIATFLAAIWTLGWDKTTQDKDWLVCISFMFLFMTASAYAIAARTKTDLWRNMVGAWKFLWLIGIGEAGAYMAITIGYSSTTHASIVAVISGASSAVTIGLARIFLKEKMTILQAVGCVTIIAGIVFLASTS